MLLLAFIGVIYFYSQIVTANQSLCGNDYICKITSFNYLLFPYFFIAGSIMFLTMGIYTKFYYLKNVTLLVLKIFLINIFSSFLVLFIAHFPLLKDNLISFPFLSLIIYMIISLSSKFVCFFCFFYLIWEMLLYQFPEKCFNFFLNNNQKASIFLLKKTIKISAFAILFWPVIYFYITSSQKLLNW